MSEIIIPGVPAKVNLQRKIRCPGHYLIPPHIDIYKREPAKHLKYVSKSIIKEYKLRTEKRCKDRYGRPIIDWNKLHKLRLQGIVKQPEITAAFAIEHIYDPQGELCQRCDKRCKRGMGKVNELSIKRLSG